MTSTRAAQARENARSTDGKFGHQEHDRADGIDLYDTDWAAEHDDPVGPAEPDWDPENVPGYAVDTRGRSFTDRRLTTRTPTDQWGEINDRYPIATGITEVSCAGHGGLGLSRERNALVPEPLRNPDGWYEEDCEYNIVVATFPREFNTGTHNNTFWTKMSEHEVEQYALGKVIDYFPEGYEKATGEELPPGASRAKDEQTWAEKHRGDFMTRSATTRDDGRISVEVRRAADGAVTHVIMSREEYDAGRESADAPKEYLGFPVDMENAELDVQRNAQTEQKEQELRARNRELMASAQESPWETGREKLTTSERERLDRWSGRLIRTQDGKVMTRGEWMAQDKVTGIQQFPDGSSGKWYANLAPDSEEGSSNFLREVPAVVAKATRHAGLPDNTSDGTREAIRQARREARTRSTGGW